MLLVFVPKRALVPPTAQTSCGPLPHTLDRFSAASKGTAAQAVPSQCTIVPVQVIVPFTEEQDPPTAQTSCWPLPHTPKRSFAPEGSDTGAQAVPFQCTAVPVDWPNSLNPPPTAQT